MQKSWFSIINDKISSFESEENNIEYHIIKTQLYYQKNSSTIINQPITKEQSYYRYIFNKHYIGCDHLIEYFWMPKYVNATCKCKNIKLL